MYGLFPAAQSTMGTFVIFLPDRRVFRHADGDGMKVTTMRTAIIHMFEGKHIVREGRGNP